jgi:hypothetical protein
MKLMNPKQTGVKAALVTWTNLLLNRFRVVGGQDPWTWCATRLLPCDRPGSGGINKTLCEIFSVASIGLIQ